MERKFGNTVAKVLNYFTSRQILRPTIVSTRVLTERETSTVRQTVSNTVFISPSTFTQRPGGTPGLPGNIFIQQRNHFVSTQNELRNLAIQLPDVQEYRQVLNQLSLLQQQFERVSSLPIVDQQGVYARLLQAQANIRSQISRVLSRQSFPGAFNSDSFSPSRSSQAQGLYQI